MTRLLLSVVVAAERWRMWLLRQRWFGSVLLPALPRQLRWALRRAYLAPIDLADRRLGRSEAGLPLKASTFTGEVDDFAESGRLLVDVLCEVAAMKPSSDVLDIGCGIGRFARPMSTFLDADGRYEGLDIVPTGIEWCRGHISSPHDNVHFTLADIRNPEYNPAGRVSAADYTFPYASETFDVAVLVSVFTHMLAAEVDRYVREIARVLRPGGRSFSTLFLITPESLDGVTSGRATMRFKPLAGPC